MIIPDSLIQRVTSLQAPAIIAVSGFGGAGKSSLASALGSKIGAPVVGVDSFFRSRTNSEYVLWEIVDFERLEREVLQPFAEAKPVRYGHFDWERNAIGDARDMPLSERMIVEGVGLFRPTLLDYFSLMIWVDCPMQEAIKRGKYRDREEYNNPQDEAWEGVWKRNDEEYFLQYDPKKTAHFIVDNCSTTTAEQGAPDARQGSSGEHR